VNSFEGIEQSSDCDPVNVPGAIEVLDPFIKGMLSKRLLKAAHRLRRFSARVG
jgi:hypothetical protein